MRKHRIEDGVDEPRCSRCGQTVYDPELYDCPAISDGELHKVRQAQEELRDELSGIPDILK